MNRKLVAFVYFIVSTIILVACTSASTPPAVRLTLEPTKTPAPTKTPKNTATPHESSLLNSIQSLMAATKIKDIEITDVRYDDGSQGARSVLLVVAKYTATPFDSSAVGNIVGTIAALATQEGNFKPGLVGLNIQMLDANLTLKQIVVVKWQDIVDFVTGRITGEQLIERLMIVSP